MRTNVSISVTQASHWLHGLYQWKLQHMKIFLFSQLQFELEKQTFIGKIPLTMIMVKFLCFYFYFSFLQKVVKVVFSMATKLIIICWIKTGSQPSWKFIHSIVISNYSYLSLYPWETLPCSYLKYYSQCWRFAY